MTTDIVVVGSINHDLTVVTARHPEPGQTVLGTDHYSGNGGKGANQAVAAARLGSRVAMIGRVGDDAQGRVLRSDLAGEGIDVTFVGVDDKAPTGVAVITIDDNAENTIVVSPGANLTLEPEHIDTDLVATANVVLAQLEIPMKTVIATAEACAGTFVLNPAPATRLSAELLARVDVLVPNRSELGMLTEGSEPTSVADAVAAVRQLGAAGATVVTLGAAGALLVLGDDITEIPAPEVEAVDPTGAGDAFCGALADGLSRGMDLTGAARRAVVAGALATTKRGAQAAMPGADEVEKLLAG